MASEAESGETSAPKRRTEGASESSADSDEDDPLDPASFHDRNYVLSLRPYRKLAAQQVLRPCIPAHCTCVRFNGFGVNNAICSCGEDDTDFDWTWDRASKSTAAVLFNADREVKFHTEYSCGTAAVRGNQPMTGSQYYWEVKMTSPVYGTDMMVGVGTSEMDLDRFRHIFGSLLGYDNESWGFSYYGNVHHKGRVKVYSTKFEQGSIIGVHLDGWRGTVAFFNNRQPLGIAYRGLQGKILYPMVASTAARSGMRVIKSRSFRSSLQFLCCVKIRELIPSEMCVLDALDLPPGLKTFLRNNLDWLLCARVSPCPANLIPATVDGKDSACSKRRHGVEEGSSTSTAEDPKRRRVT